LCNLSFSGANVFFRISTFLWLKKEEEDLKISLHEILTDCLLLPRCLLQRLKLRSENKDLTFKSTKNLKNPFLFCIYKRSKIHIVFPITNGCENRINVDLRSATPFANNSILITNFIYQLCKQDIKDSRNTENSIKILDLYESYHTGN
jgi:hypothetical protein